MEFRTILMILAAATIGTSAFADDDVNVDVPKGTIGIVCRDGAGTLLSSNEASLKPQFNACVREALKLRQAEKSALDLTEYLNGYRDYENIGTQLRIENAFPVKN
jgi:hypothetical protein